MGVDLKSDFRSKMGHISIIDHSCDDFAKTSHWIDLVNVIDIVDRSLLMIGNRAIKYDVIIVDFKIFRVFLVNRFLVILTFLQIH